MKVQSVVGIATSLAVMALLAGPAAARNVEIEFDASNFTPGAQIDNPYWPLIAGTTFVYAAEEDDGCVVELRAPQVVAIDPGHDGWVVGNEPVVLIEFDFERETIDRLGMPDAHRH